VAEISELQTIWEGFDFTYILSIVLGLIPSLICISFHEFSHGCAAYFLGDSTAKERGRLTLNPIKHLDPVGILMLLVFRFGWAKPVPVNMYKFKNPKRGMAITALAGPASNIVLGSFSLLVYGMLFIPLYDKAAGRYLLEMIEITAYMSIGLAVFNLIPVPPLDGSKVLFSVISNSAYKKLMQYERYGTIVMLLLIWFGILGRPISNAVGFVYDKLFLFAEFGFDIIKKII